MKTKGVTLAYILQHLNAAAEGKRAPGPVLHLARDSLLDKTDPSTYQLANVSLPIQQTLLEIIIQ